MTNSAWDEIAAVIATAPYPVTVLAADPERAERCLHGLGITTESWLGALVKHSGGLLVDHGWLRVLGSGADTLPDILADVEPGAGGFPVAYDVLGGVYVWAAGGEQRPTIHCFQPDTLEWQDLGLGYADWLNAMLTGSVDRFYASLRWPDWQQEVGDLAANQGLHTFPPPWSQEGRDLAAASRKAVPLAELVSLHQDTARQVAEQQS